MCVWELERVIKRRRDSGICRWLSRVFWFELCWRVFHIPIVKKQHESISVWCANISSFKGKVSLDLAALREGTPDFGYTSVTSVRQDRDAPESFSSQAKQDSVVFNREQVKYWELTNIPHTSPHEFLSSVFVLKSLLGFRGKLKMAFWK